MASTFVDVNTQSNMNLKHWVLHNLKCSNFKDHGIEWIDEKNKYFKVIWVEQHKPGWEKFEKLLTSWASNKDGQIKPQTITQRRARFRDAMRNSNYFEEVKNEQNLQTGNHKVYRFLSTDEVKAKKERQKKKKSTDESEQSTPTYDSPSLQDLLDVVDDIDFSEAPSSGGDANVNSQLPTEFDLDVLLNAMEFSGIQPSGDPEQKQLPMICNEIPPLPPAVVQDTDLVQQPFPHFNNLQEFLAEGFTDEELLLLTKFVVMIEYENTLVYQKIIDFAQECIFCIGGIESKFVDWPHRFLEEHFPPYDGKNTCVNAVLNGLTGGFMLKVNPYHGLVAALRRSKMQIFYFNSDHEKEGKKMNRYEETNIFSYFDYIQDMLSYRANGRDCRPCCEVMLAFGTCPKSPMSKTLIKLTLKPVLHEKLNQFVGYSESSISLLFSDEQSLNNLSENFNSITSGAEMMF